MNEGIIAVKNDEIMAIYLLSHAFNATKYIKIAPITPMNIGRYIWTFNKSIPVIFEIIEVKIGNPCRSSTINDLTTVGAIGSILGISP